MCVCVCVLQSERRSKDVPFILTTFLSLSTSFGSSVTRFFCRCRLLLALGVKSIRKTQTSTLMLRSSLFLSIR
jgi:hypothetical protein